MNDTHVTVTGWLGTNVTLREVGDGRALASFRVGSTPVRLRDGDWTRGPTTWHQVKAWGRLARHCAESLRTGDPVLLHGRLVMETWTRPDGQVASRFEVIASSVGHDLTHGTSMWTRPSSEQDVGEGTADAEASPTHEAA